MAKGRAMVYSESHGLVSYQPMSGETCLPLVFQSQTSDESQTYCTVRKTEAVSARRGQQELCLLTFGGQSVCPSTHPSSGHYPLPNPFSAPLSLSLATPLQGM